MDKQGRQRIAILFNFRKGWMGGIIYIINLVNALDFLDEDSKPEIIIFYDQDLEGFIKDFKYSYLEFVPWFFPSLWKGYLGSWLVRKNLFVNKIIEEYKPIGIYPLNDWPISGKFMLEKGTRVVGWIPDLQHKFYPHFFTKLRVFFREQRIKMLLRNTGDLAVSSHDVESHFKKFYSIKPSLRIHALRFVSLISNTTFRPLVELQNQYAIPAHYFIVSNQFTNHKNHMVLLDALRILKEKRFTIFFVLTGKTDFKGNENYISQIRTFIKTHGLENSINMTGIIPRQDQLSLMKHARAVVQPSLFEGWSTVIEDAKSLRIPVLASNLPVNMEQLQETATFFDPCNASELATKLENFNQQSETLRYDSYENRVRKFAEDFMDVFKS